MLSFADRVTTLSNHAQYECAEQMNTIKNVFFLFHLNSDLIKLDTDTVFTSCVVVLLIRCSTFTTNQGHNHARERHGSARYMLLRLGQGCQECNQLSLVIGCQSRT